MLKDIIEAGVRQQANQAISISNELVPDHEARLKETQAKTGAPLDYLRSLTPDQLNRITAVNPLSVISPESALNQFYSDPSRAAIAFDDAENLAKVEGIWGNLKSIGKKLRDEATELVSSTFQGGKRGKLSADLGSLYYDKYLGNNQVNETDLQKAELELQAIDDESSKDLVDQMFGEAGYLVGQQIPVVPEVVAAAAAGGAAGGVVGGLPGAATGAGLGARGAFISNAFFQEAGHAAHEFSGMTDEFGEKLNPDAVRIAAYAVGAVNAGLELVGAEQLLKLAGMAPGIKTVKNAVTRDGFRALLKDPNIRKAMTDLGKKYGSGIGIESLQEMMQELTTIIGGAAIGGEQDDVYQLISRVMETGARVAAGTAILGLPALTSGSVASVMRAREAASYRDSLINLKQAIDQTNTAARSKETAREALELMGLHQAYISGAEASELSPEIQAAMGLTADQVNKAKAQGTDLDVSLGQAILNLSEEQFKTAVEVLRVDPKAVSVKAAEGMDLNAEILKTMSLYQTAVQQESDFKVRLEELKNQIVSAGRSVEEADAAVSLMDGYARRMALEGRELNQTFLESLRVKKAEYTDPDGVTYNQDGLANIDTPEFKNWFGDSKVVDDEGKPLVLLHRTTKKFDTFSMNFAGRNTLGNASDAGWAATSFLGFWFAGPDSKGGMPGNIDMKAYVSLKNPKYIDSLQTLSERIAKYFPEEFEGDPRDIKDAADDYRDFLISKGYDGIAVDDEEFGGTSYVAFEPTQIKSVENRGSFDPENANIYYQQDNLGFYSALENAVSEMDFKQMPAKDLINRIQKTTGIKAEELEWTGLLDWLKGLSEAGEKVSKDQVLDFIQAGGVKLEEVRKEGEGNFYTLTEAAAQETYGVSYAELTSAQKAFIDNQVRDSGMMEDSTKFSRYQLPGGGNYREVLLTLPGPTIQQIAKQQFGKEWNELSEGQQIRVMNIKRKDSFESAHWGEPNVLVHFRLNDRMVDGKKTLFIEEIQSDWHQTGRGRGYRGEALQYGTRIEGYIPAGYSFRKGVRKNKSYVVYELISEKGEVISEGTDKMDALRKSGINVAALVPSAPFKATPSWALLAIKRIIRMAAEEGYDKVAWTPGEVQAERYNLSKDVTIDYKHGKGSIWVHAVSVHSEQTVFEKHVKPEDLEGIVGKDVAKKIMDNEGVERSTQAGKNIRERGKHTGIFEREGRWYISFADGKEMGTYISEESARKEAESIDEMVDEPPSRHLEGSDLKVGGEGMKGFYDKILPTVVKDYLKKQDKEAKISPVDIPTDTSSITALSFPVTETMKEKVMQGQSLFQNSGAPRGMFTPLPDGYLITLLGNANKSTIPHELAHAFLHDMRVWYLQGNASDNFKADFEAVLKFIGAPAADMITVEQHEIFAKSFEAYLREGVAPSSRLRKIFHQYRNWLVRLYHKVTTLGVTLNPEITAVFDRMLASDNEIALAAQTAELTPLTADEIKQLQMTPEQTTGLKKLYDKAIEAGKMQLEKLRAEKRAEIESRVRDQITKEVEEMPLYRLRKDMRDGKQGMDKPLVVAMFGEETAKALNKKLPGLVRAEGWSPQDLAELYDYADPMTMVLDIMESPGKAEAINKLTEERMKEEDSKIAADETLMGTAELGDYLAEFNNFVRAAIRNGGTPVRTQNPREVYQRAAEQNLAQLSVREAVRVDKFELALNRAIKTARDKVNKGKFMDALQANEQARLMAEMVRASRKFRDELRKKISKARKNLAADKGKIHEGHHLNMWTIALRFNIFADSPAKAAERLQAIGLDPNKKPPLRDILQPVPDSTDPAADIGADFDQFIMDETFTKDYRDLTADQVNQVMDVLEMLNGRGRELVNYQILHMKQSLNEVAEDLALQAVKNKKAVKVLDENKFFAKLVGQFREYMASRKIMQFIFRALDGYKTSGLFNNVIMIPLAQAESARTARLREVTSLMEPAILRLLKRSMNTPIQYGPPIGDGKLWTFERVVALALNMGNTYNRNAVLEGYGLSQATANQLMSVLTDGDWDDIQTIWDAIDSLWADMDAAFYDMNYYHQKKVQADPFVTVSGKQMKGGYYPLKTDPDLSDRAEQWSEIDDMMSTAVSLFPSARSGMMKSRTKFGVKPVLLDMSLIATHVQSAVTYITHARLIKDIDRILRQPQLSANLKEVLGKQNVAMFRPWLRYIVRGDEARLNGLEKWLERQRTLSTLYIMGANVRVAVTQVLGIFNSISEAGAKAYFSGAAQILSHPLETYQFIVQNSEVMRDRGMSMDRDLRKTLQELKPSSKLGVPLAAVQESLFMMIQLCDMTVSFPAWLGTYQQALNRSAETDPAKAIRTAVAEADNMLASMQPVSRSLDLSHIQRSRSGMHRLFTMFSSFTILYGNRVEYFWEGFQEGKISPMNFARFVVLETLLPPMVQLYMLSYLQGREPDPEETIAELAMYQVSGFPIIREALNYSISKAAGKYTEQPGRSPLFTGSKIAGDAAKDVGNLVFKGALSVFFDKAMAPDEAEWHKAVWAFADLTSYSLGIPASKVYKNLRKGMDQWESGEGTAFNILVPAPEREGK